MKRLLLPLLALLIPAAHATNYVECEAIRNVISRTEVQLKEAEKKAMRLFVEKKIRDNFGSGDPEIKDCSQVGDQDTFVRSTCEAFASNVFEASNEEAKIYIQEFIKPYVDVQIRATKDFKKRGCYYF